MHSDLQKARYRLSWAASDIISLAKMNTIESYSTAGRSSEKLTWYELEEVTTVYEWLVGQRSNNNNAVIPSLERFPFHSLPSPEEMTSYWSDMPEVDLEIPANLKIHWEDIANFLRRIPSGQIFVYIYLSKDLMSPIKNVPLHYFWRYGITLWDVKRLFALGLWTLQLAMTGPMFTNKLRGDMVYKWRSLLSDEELEIVESNLEPGSRLANT